jgi:hypothetical protein
LWRCARTGSYMTLITREQLGQCATSSPAASSSCTRCAHMQQQGCPSKNCPAQCRPGLSTPYNIPVLFEIYPHTDTHRRMLPRPHRTPYPLSQPHRLQGKNTEHGRTSRDKISANQSATAIFIQRTMRRHRLSTTKGRQSPVKARWRTHRKKKY